MSLRHAAIGLLAQRPGSGYDLLKRFQESLALVWPATQSQLYTELVRLEKEGLISVGEVGPRGRKVYHITDAGRAELRQWLLSTEPEPDPRSGNLLRTFLFTEVSPADARDFLERAAGKVAIERGHLEDIRDDTDWDDTDEARYQRIVLEWGLRFRAMQQEWARWALTQLPAPRPPAPGPPAAGPPAPQPGRTD